MFTDIKYGVCMKKILFKILIGVFAVALLCSGLLACKSSNDWKGTHSGWGEGNIVGGFVGQKGDYVYFINGTAISTADNTMGTPVKGTLMAAKKDDLSKTHVVVPKLFAATDYKAGLYIYGDYVYYASPSTDKTSSGTVAYTELAFLKTKLDGTGTETFFTLNTLAAEYRILEVEGKVYIVYYDSTDSALKCFNTSNKETFVVAKNDATVKGENAKSLDAYKFAEDLTGGVAVYYTATVYAEDYYENKAATEGYARAEQDYNLVCSYTPGDVVAEKDNVAGKVVLNAEKTVYELTVVDGDKIFYTATKDNETTTHELKTKTEIKNSEAVADTNVIVEEEDGLWSYALDSSTKAITKAPLCNDADKINLETEGIIVAEGASSLIAKSGEYLYYYNDANVLMRVKVDGMTGDEKLEQVSKDTVSVTWFAPEFITIGENDYVFYCDNSSTGASYVHYVKANGEVKAEDTDDDGENDKFYLDGHALLGVMIESDRANVFTALVSKISTSLDGGILPYEEKEDGTLFVATIDQAQAIYDNLSAEAKNAVLTETMTSFNNYKEAVKMANVLRKLDGIVNYDSCDETAKTAYKDAYNAMKAEVEAFKDKSTFSTVSALLQKNMLWNYQKATSLFETK